MPRIPTPLTWRRRNFAVFEPLGMIDRLFAVAVSGLVSGPFAIYKSPRGQGFTLIHQEMRNIHARLKPDSWIASDWSKKDP